LAYATKADVRALTGLSTAQISDADLDTLISIADMQIDNESGYSLSSEQKTLASQRLSAVFAIQHANGTLAIDNLMEISGAIKIDTKTAALIRNEQARRFYREYKEILEQAPSTDLIVKVE